MSSRLLKDFTKLNELCFVHHPDDNFKTAAGRSSTSTTPSLIVLCTWMGAATKHIAKYTDEYMARYPASTILVCQTTIYTMILGSDLSIASDVIIDHVAGNSSVSARPVLFHVMSNGGATAAIRLCESMRRKSPKTEIPIATMIFDSCPGTGDLATGARAISFSLPNNLFIRMLGTALIWMFLVLYALYHEVTRTEDGITRMRHRLNDPELFPLDIPRVYLYSKADQLVPWQDVRGHAEDARRRGYHVGEEVFERAPHCALLQEDGTKYWAAVAQCLSKAAKAFGG